MAQPLHIRSCRIRDTNHTRQDVAVCHRSSQASVLIAVLGAHVRPGPRFGPLSQGCLPRSRVLNFTARTASGELRVYVKLADTPATMGTRDISIFRGHGWCTTPIYVPQPSFELLEDTLPMVFLRASSIRRQRVCAGNCVRLMIESPNSAASPCQGPTRARFSRGPHPMRPTGPDGATTPSSKKPLQPAKSGSETRVPRRGNRPSLGVGNRGNVSGHQMATSRLGERWTNGLDQRWHHGR